MERQFQFGEQTIKFTLSHKNRKTLGLKVHPSGMVEAVAPIGVSDKKVIEKVEKKAHWIVKQQNFFNSFKPIITERRYISGETHYYLGRQYRLKLLPNKTLLKAYQGQMVLGKEGLNAESIKEEIYKWYKQKAEVIFNELLEISLNKFQKYKIEKPQLIIRKMSKRWGSCTPSKKIILNLELIKAPKACIEYVIIHELCHLVHPNHSKSFQLLLSRTMPEWRKWKERLETMKLF